MTRSSFLVLFACALLALLCLADVANGSNVTALTTFYGAKDNCPPGGDIAYPILHKEAGGLGTYSNPITYAGDKRVTAPGTVIYVFFLEKYFIMEDECQECVQDWNRKKAYHFDLWMGPDNVLPGPYLVECEDALTVAATLVEIDPPSSYSVNVQPLFNGTSQQCIDSGAPPCICIGSDCDVCGNECQTPDAATCQQLAQLLGLSDKRFAALNPSLNCSQQIPAGTTVCMGGPCGD